MTTRSLRLSTRLFLAFSAVVLMSALSAGLALLKLREIEHDMTQIVTVNNVKTALGHEMADAVHIVAQVVRSIALLQDEGQMAEEVTKIDKARADYDRARAALEQFPASERGKTLRAAIDAAAAATRAINNRALELAASRRTTEVTTLLLKESDPATQTWLSALDQNVKWQAEESRADYERSRASAAHARQLLIGASVMSALIAIGLTLLVVRSITRELGGEPSEVARLAQSIAAADMSTLIPARPGDTTSVMACMALMQTALSTVVQAVRSNADSVATASAQIAQGNADLSHRTEEQASALQQTAATMDQLSATVRRNADNARQARQLALNASGVASHGGEVVGKVVHTMKGINDSSKKIADIIGVIDGIAFQTNILALNAAVEAARAGEQGRGFAVVAGEVRTLAQRSADAAQQIKTLIHDSVGRVEHGTSLVDDAGHAMQDIVASICRVSDIVAEISSASTEQSTGVSQVGQAVGQMDQATQQNAALVEESAAAAESLKHQAHELVQAVSVFKLHPGLPPALASTV